MKQFNYCKNCMGILNDTTAQISGGKSGILRSGNRKDCYNGQKLLRCDRYNQHLYINLYNINFWLIYKWWGVVELWMRGKKREQGGSVGWPPCLKRGAKHEHTHQCSVFMLSISCQRLKKICQPRAIVKIPDTPWNLPKILPMTAAWRGAIMGHIWQGDPGTQGAAYIRASVGISTVLQDLEQPSSWLANGMGCSENYWWQGNS